MTDEELMSKSSGTEIEEEFKRQRAAAAHTALARINELWLENEELIERSRAIHREMAEIMATIPPAPDDAS